MRSYRGCRILAVTARDRICDRGMFVTARAAIECLPQMKVPITYRPIMQGTGDLAHHGIAGQIGETSVEGSVRVNEIVELRASTAVDLHARQLLEFLGLLRGHPASRVARQVSFDRHT